MGLFYVWKAMNSHEFASVRAGKLASYPKGSRGLRVPPGVEVKRDRSTIRSRFASSTVEVARSFACETPKLR